MVFSLQGPRPLNSWPAWNCRAILFHQNNDEKINAKLEKSNETRDVSLKFIKFCLNLRASGYSPANEVPTRRRLHPGRDFTRESTARKLVVKQKRLEPLKRYPKLNGKGEKNL